MEERSTESICKEYMCCQCGNLYYQAGYKIVQVPVPGAVPTPSPFEFKPAVTQEPAGLRKSETEPVVTQEPAGSSKIKKEAPTVVNKAVQTLPIKEITPPSQVTSREQSTQTLPGPTTTNAQTQTSHQSGGMNMRKYKGGRRSMLRNKLNNCKYTSKIGGITLS
jgi:hypothetical protein